MKKPWILTAFFFASFNDFSQTVDLKLSERNKEEDRIATGKGLIIFGTILSTGSALFLNKADDMRGPQIGLFTIG